MIREEGEVVDDGLSNLLRVLSDAMAYLWVEDGDLHCVTAKIPLSPQTLEEMKRLKPKLIEIYSFEPDKEGRLVTLKPGSDEFPVVICPHTIHGGVLDYRYFASKLSVPMEVIGIQAPELLHGRPMPDSISEIVSRYREDIWPTIQSRDYIIYGVSGGGILAMELAAQLVTAGSSPTSLVIGDSCDPAISFGRSASRSSVVVDDERHADRGLWISFLQARFGHSMMTVLDRTHPFWQMSHQERCCYLASQSRGATATGEADLATEIGEQLGRYEEYCYSYARHDLPEYRGQSLFIHASGTEFEYSKTIRSKLPSHRVVHFEGIHLHLVTIDGSEFVAHAIESVVRRR